MRVPAMAGDTPIDISERSYFERVLESGAFAVGEYEMDAATGLAPETLGPGSVGTA